MAFPSENVARAVSVLLRPSYRPREVYETAGHDPRRGSGLYCITYSAGTEAEGLVLSTQEVEWMVAHNWLRRDPECPGLLTLAKGKPRASTPTAARKEDDCG